jgi:hypothetical protein
MSAGAAITAMDPSTGQFVSQPNIPNNTINLQAGQTLTVDAQTMLPADDPLTTRLQWNFGDLGAYSILPGYNAAHVYDVPGTYQATLTTTLADAPSSPLTATLTVQVSPDARQQVYVSPNGSGPVADGSSPSNTLDFATLMQAGLSSNTDYLFEDNQTYECNQWIWVAGLSNVTLSTFSTGPGQTAAPVFNGYGEGGTYLFQAAGVAFGNLTINGIDFDNIAPPPSSPTAPPPPAAAPYVVMRTSDNVAGDYGLTIENCAFDNVDTATTLSQSAKGVLVQGNWCNVVPDYFVWDSGTDVAVLGNTALGSQNQNLVRGDEGYDQGFNRWLVYGNDLYNQEPDSKDDLDFRMGQYAYAADNAFHTYAASGVNSGLGFSLGLDINGNPETIGCTYGVVEGNFFDVGTKVEIHGGAHNISVRDNAIDIGQTPNMLGAIEIGRFASETTPDTNVQVLNNTLYSAAGPAAALVQVDGPVNPTADSGDVESAPEITMENNLTVAPGLASGSGQQDVLVMAADTSSFLTVSNNLWQRGNYDSSGNSNEFMVNGVGLTLDQWDVLTGANDREQGSGSGNPQVVLDGTSFTTPGGASFPTHFMPDAANTSEVNIGADLAGAGATGDLYGVPRPSANLTVGAVQTPPPVPRNIKLVSFGGNVSLTWWPVTSDNTLAKNVQGYNVYRASSPSGPWTRLTSSPVAQPSYSDPNPGIGTWYYAVTAVDWGGNESARSVPASVPIGGSSASLVKTDPTTSGTWTAAYGSDGYDVIDGTSSLPSYASIKVTAPDLAAYEYSWLNNSPAALQTASGSTSRVAACDYSDSGAMTVNVNINDGKIHQVALYLLDADNEGRVETVQAFDANTGAALASAPVTTVSHFANGQYLVYNLSGNVNLVVTNGSGSLNCVVSGIFFGPGLGSSASLLKTDTTTAGSWTGVYGADGYDVIAGNSSLPSYASMTVTAPDLGSYEWYWLDNTTQALQTAPGASTRAAGVDYSNSGTMTVHVNIGDGKAHRFALYLLDGDNVGRTETVQVFDATHGAALTPATTVSNFSSGEYLVYNLSGNVNLVITKGSGSANAVLSGAFFG